MEWSPCLRSVAAYLPGGYGAMLAVMRCPVDTVELRGRPPINRKVCKMANSRLPLVLSAFVMSFPSVTLAQEGAARAAIVLWEKFDVPAAAMADVTRPLNPSCAPHGPAFRSGDRAHTSGASWITCVDEYATSSAIVCRGVGVAWMAGAIYEQVKRKTDMMTTLTVKCTEHRVEVRFVPNISTTVTEYERSEGRRIYRKRT